MNNKNKKIIIGSVIVLILGAVGYFAFYSEIPKAKPLIEGSSPEELDKISQDIKDLLAKIESVELNKRLFEMKIYLNLVDHSKEIPIRGVGRPNPFEPLPGQGLNIDAQTSVSN